MPQVIIIDYQSGNTFSVQQALKSIGVPSTISSSITEIEQADAIVFPGMGAFPTAMEKLRKLGLDDAIKNFVKAGKPFLGVCLGMQLLFKESEEFGDTPGLGIVDGRVLKFPNTYQEQILRVPQIAWNKIQVVEGQNWKNSPLELVNQNEYMYFVHSYYVKPTDNSIILSTTKYGDISYTSSLATDNIFACQFHPEKSGKEGLKIYKTWALQNKLIK